MQEYKIQLSRPFLQAKFLYIFFFVFNYLWLQWVIDFIPSTGEKQQADTFNTF